MRCPLFSDSGEGFFECRFSFKAEDGALLLEQNERKVSE